MNVRANESVWHSFPDGGPPHDLIVRWRMLLALPRGAQSNLWQLIEVVLERPDDPDNTRLFESFARHFQVDPAPVLGAVQACDQLLHQAAAMNLEKAAFLADLAGLSGGDQAGMDLLGARYEDIRDGLRVRLLEATLADHGNVLVDFDWRVDQVRLSNRGRQGDALVVFLNLKYQSRGGLQQLSLQLPPRTMASLKAFCDQFDPA